MAPRRTRRHVQLRARRVDAAAPTGSTSTSSIVPSSGTGELAGIAGTGVLVVDADGTHRMRFDYTLGGE